MIEFLTSSTVVFFFISFFMALTIIIQVYEGRKRKKDASIAEKGSIDVDSLALKLVNDLEQKINRNFNMLPSKVLESIQSSINTKEGILGELIASIKMRSDYDRLIPMNNICDFIGINLGKDGKSGSIDFIEVKTGKSAKLSKDQKAMKSLIEKKQVNFIEYKINKSM